MVGRRVRGVASCQGESVGLFSVKSPMSAVRFETTRGTPVFPGVQPEQNRRIYDELKILRLLPGPEGCPNGLGRFPPTLPKPGLFLLVQPVSGQTCGLSAFDRGDTILVQREADRIHQRRSNIL
jgi:hypothetical protein